MLRYGRVLITAVGLALVVTGTVALMLGKPSGAVILVVGIVALVLGVLPWSKFRAEVSKVKFEIEHQPAVPPAAAPPPVSPRLKILSVEARGGHDTLVDFAADVVNTGDVFARATVTATLNGEEMQVHPVSVDLEPHARPQTVRVFVPRPRLGTLDKRLNDETILYGRALEVVIAADGSSDSMTWREIEYSPDDNLGRYAIQRRLWAEGRGEDPSTIELPPPLPLVEGAGRVHRCNHCGVPTAQVLQRVQRSGSGKVIAALWACHECGQNPGDLVR